MSKVTRRRFLIAGGAGAIAVAAGGAALAIRQFTKGGSSASGTLTFQAIAALPRPPLVSYASYVITGQVDVGSKTGTLTRAAFAGDPDNMLPIPFFTHQIRVTDAQSQGSSWSISGVIDDTSQLQKGEDANFSITIYPEQHTAQTDYFSSPIQLQLKQWKDTSQQADSLDRLLRASR